MKTKKVRKYTLLLEKKSQYFRHIFSLPLGSLMSIKIVLRPPIVSFLTTLSLF